MKRETIAVSACLLGVNCKYNAKNNLNFKVIEYLKGKEVVLVCPEELGGLSTPRISSEIQKDGRVINREGLDVTDNFLLGAKKHWQYCNKKKPKASSSKTVHRLVVLSVFMTVVFQAPA
jgi:uncharacterized protein YbbK (DUF523 family)